MKNKFIAQKITAIQRYMPLGFLLLSAFNFICFASAAILENAQQITQNPLSDDPIAPRIIILAVVWGSIFIGSILVFLFPSPIVKGQAPAGNETPNPETHQSDPAAPETTAQSGLCAPPCSRPVESDPTGLDRRGDMVESIISSIQEIDEGFSQSATELACAMAKDSGRLGSFAVNSLTEALLHREVVGDGLRSSSEGSQQEENKLPQNRSVSRQEVR